MSKAAPVAGGLSFIGPRSVIEPFLRASTDCQPVSEIDIENPIVAAYRKSPSRSSPETSRNHPPEKMEINRSSESPARCRINFFERDPVHLRPPMHFALCSAIAMRFASAPVDACT